MDRLMCEDLDRGKSFWETNGNGFEFKCRLLREGMPVLCEEDEKDIGIRLCQVKVQKYSRKSDELKKKIYWVTDKGIKRKETENSAYWRFIPLAITPFKQSAKPEDQRFIYFMELKQAKTVAAKAHNEENVESLYYRIETDLKGSIKGCKYYAEAPHEELPAKVAFPKRYVAKMNRCLLQNYWSFLRPGNYPEVYTWYRTDEGRVWYLAQQYRDLNLEYQDALVQLLNSPAGDAAAVLLAYVCFAVTKEFFPRYPVLHRDTPYLTAKKGLIKTFALNLQGAPDLIEQLTGFFCQPFQEAAWPKTTTAGIRVMPVKKADKLVKLGVNEFENETLQPASVLWLNRKPDGKLIESGQIINITVTGMIPSDLRPFARDFLRQLTGAVHDFFEERLELCWDECWKQSRPIVQGLVMQIEKIAQKYFFPIDTVDNWKDVKEDMEKEHSYHDPLLTLSTMSINLQRAICEDVLSYDPDPEYQQMQETFRTEFAACRRQLKKINKKIFEKHYSLQMFFEKALGADSTQTKVPQRLQNLAYLSAATDFFIQGCVTEEESTFIRWRVNSAIQKLRPSALRPSAMQILETYILSVIRLGQYARIRGKGCDKAKLWYCPRKREFYLPKDSYFEKIKKVCSTNSEQLDKKCFEVELAEKGVLQVSAQGRRSKQLNVDGKGKRSLLALREAGFPESFLKKPVVQTALAKMDSDKTPYRA